MSYVFYLLLTFFSSPSEDLIVLPSAQNHSKIIKHDDYTRGGDALILPGEPNEDY